MIRSLAFLLPLLCLAACGGAYKDAAPAGQALALQGQNLSLLTGTVSVSGNALQADAGGGRVLGERAMDTVSGGVSYALDFSLREGGELTLFSHASSTLGSGFELAFRREGTGPGSLKVTLRAGENSKDTVNADQKDVFAGLDAARPLRLQIDVHNNEAPAHVLVWDAGTTARFRGDNALLDTEDDYYKSNGSPGNGTGRRWGLALKDASVTRAEPSAVKAGH